MLLMAARRVGARMFASSTTRCAIRDARCCMSCRRTTSRGSRGRLRQEIGMSRQIRPFITPEEYLDLERKADYKSEYLHGEVFAMTGASRQHNLIAANLSRTLGNQLVDRPCELYV